MKVKVPEDDRIVWHMDGHTFKLPRQKPGESRQDYPTPPEFIEAVEKRWGPISFDLAATKSNAKALRFFSPKENSLEQAWPVKGINWLNPPYGKIQPWAKKCSDWVRENPDASSRILFLVPASVGSNWFWSDVWPSAIVHSIHPRISFDGIAPYPKDLILCEFGALLTSEMRRWEWKK